MDAKGASSVSRDNLESSSTTSTGSRPTKSQESMGALESHSLGTHQVMGLDSSPRLSERLDAQSDDDPGPPPLEPPLERERGFQVAGNPYGARQSSSDSPNRGYREYQAHGMGGGDVALILDLPDIFTVGYDCLSFEAKNFFGVRDIPPGPHFFWVTHPSAVAARSGVWLLGKPYQDLVHVVQWDKNNETLTEATLSEIRRHAGNVPNIHAQLVSFPDPSAITEGSGNLSATKIETNRSIWRQLTTHVTAAVLDRITGPQVGGWVVHTLDRAQSDVQSSAEVELDRAMASQKSQQQELHFSFERSTRLFSLASLGPERTLEARDPTTHLVHHIEDRGNDLVYDDLIGEFQFSFIVGVHLGTDACLEQWWYMLLKLFIKSHLLVEKQPLLVASVWHTATAQITYASNWMETSILDGNETKCRELRIGLIIYKRRLEEFLQGDENGIEPNHLAVSTAFSRFEAVLTDLGWDLSGDYLRKGLVMMEDGEEIELELSDLEAEDERGEWAPEIVETDENGRQVGLISWSD